MGNLGELEAQVMQRLWDWGRECTVREVFDDLVRQRRLAYTTVMTVMDNLFKKGFVTRTVRGRAYLYRSAKTREEHAADLIGYALDAAPDRTAGLLRFVERLDRDEVSTLRSVLDRLDRADEGR